MKVKFLAVSGIVSALYIAVSLVVPFLSFGPLQIRFGEMFNHLVIFNKKYFYAIVVGVFITNLFSSNGPLDLVFGVGQTIIALVITIISAKYIQSVVKRMIFNAVVFSFMMWLVALELVIVLKVPFGYTWMTLAAGELAIMLISIPIMLALNKRFNLNKAIA